VIRLVLLVLLLAAPAHAGWVNTYTRRDGTVVQGHRTTSTHAHHAKAGHPHMPRPHRKHR
jgi:hypothetical protein